MKWQTQLIFALHVLLLVVFSYFTFWHNSARLFIVADGPTFVSLAQEQLKFFGVSSDLHTNFLEGLGNISIATNLSVIPAHWFKEFGASGTFKPAATYTFYTIILFIAVLLTGWNYRFKSNMCYAAAWLLVIIFMPYFRRFGIYPLPAFMPHLTLLLFSAAIINISIQHISKGGWYNTVFYSIVLIISLVALLVTNPLIIVLTVPFLAITTFFVLRSAPQENILRILAVGTAIFAVSAALGWVEYFAGLFLNTAYGFFHHEMQQAQPQQLEEASLLFQVDYCSRVLGPYFFVAASLGGTIALIKKDMALRQPAIILFIAQALFAGLGGAIMLQPIIWGGPRPVYFETLFFPLYALFTVYFITCIIEMPAISAYIPKNQSIRNLLLIMPITIVALFLLLPPLDQDRSFYPYKNVGSNLGIPPSSNSITDILEKEIGIYPGSVFSGRAMTIVPGIEFMQQYIYFIAVDRASGNDYQMTGLWLKGIPTLHEYNQLITPGFYWLDREFLSEPGVPIMRNWTNFSKINLPIMRLLGVRFIISTLPGIEWAKERATFNIPFGKGEYIDRATLHLFELSGANVSGISAKEIVTVNTIEQAGSLMKSRSFDGSTAIVKSELLPEKELPAVLTPATESQLRIEKGAWHLYAKSAGWTMLILPMDFSKCMEITPVSGRVPRVIRVDVALTGILFNQEVDIKFVTKTGLFTNPRCRLQDYRDFKTMLQPAF